MFARRVDEWGEASTYRGVASLAPTCVDRTLSEPCRSGACASSLSQEVPPPRVLWPAPDLAHETATNEALEPGAGRPRREADHRGDLALGKAVGSAQRVKNGLVGALDHRGADRGASGSSDRTSSSGS
jgi:hypothetical protein